MTRSLSTRRRNLPIPLNIMVVGLAGSGKTSFINTFIKSLEVGEQHNDIKEKAPLFQYNQTSEITTRKVTTTSQGLRLALSFIDTPGFEVRRASEARKEPILEYIKNSLFLRLQEETRLKRNTKPKEEQIHVCLFFVQPSLVHVSETELAFAKRLSKYVNILPVIGKADNYTVSELREMKSVIQRDFRFHSIPIFDFSDEEQEEEEEIRCENEKLRDLLPFTLISSEEVQPRNSEGIRVLGREYSWGVVECFNPNHSNMASLKSALLETHLHVLKEITYLRLYEDYRTEQLLSDLRLKSIRYSKDEKVTCLKETFSPSKPSAKPLDDEIVESKLESSSDSGFSWDSTSNFHEINHPISSPPTRAVNTSVVPGTSQSTNKPQLRNSSGKSVRQLNKLYSTTETETRTLSDIRHNHELFTHPENPCQTESIKYQALPVSPRIKLERPLAGQVPKELVLPTLPENKNPPVSTHPSPKPCKFRKTSRRRHVNCTIN